MRKIFKYPLEVTSEQHVEMPQAALILCVQVQGGIPFLWAEVVPGAARVKRTIAIYGTGHDMIVREADNYIGTFQLEGGALVFHVYSD